MHRLLFQDAFHETRLRVYLKAAAWDARAYTAALHQALFDAEQREIELPADLPGLDALRRSPDYQKFRKQQRRSKPTRRRAQEGARREAAPFMD